MLSNTQQYTVDFESIRKFSVANFRFLLICVLLSGVESILLPHSETSSPLKDTSCHLLNHRRTKPSDFKAVQLLSELLILR